jgi:hypothetical protein
MRRLAVLLWVAVLASTAFAAERVTVAQLEQALAAGHGKPDKELAQQIGGLQLTERLNTARLATLQTELPGSESRQALLALADASAFLDLPAAELLPLAAPDRATQGRIFSQAAEFVAAALPKLPDFFASRTTTRFQDVKFSQVFNQPIAVHTQGFYLLDATTVTANFRNGKELDQPQNGKKSSSLEPPQSGLNNWGVFGPLLVVVMTDVLKSRIGWGHWEQGDAGPIAVFRYAVPEDKSNYSLKYCCFRATDGSMRELSTTTAYHGEIAVDPKSGAVLRVALKADFKPGMAINRADTMVEYGAVEIGGKSYICPLKSVSVSTATDNVTKTVWSGVSTSFQESVSTPKVTAINDIVFDHYHQFRGEMHILPADGSETGGPLPNPMPATSPRP